MSCLFFSLLYQREGYSVDQDYGLLVFPGEIIDSVVQSIQHQVSPITEYWGQLPTLIVQERNLGQVMMDITGTESKKVDLKVNTTTVASAVPQVSLGLMGEQRFTLSN